jgi:elongation factor Ts
MCTPQRTDSFNDEEEHVEVMEITGDMIRQLREKTGAGMMDCKRALEASGGNMEAAIELLRKKGAATVQKRADRAAKEGMIVTRVSNGGKTGVVVEVNCETDFVGRSGDFMGFASAIAEMIEQHTPGSLDQLATLRNADGRSFNDMLNDLLAKVGEKIEVRRFGVFESADGAITSYTHLGNKIGVLVEMAGIDASAPVGRDVAMQIAAMNPMVITRDQIDKATIERELDIYRAQTKAEGKPDHILDRIALGRLEKFYQEVCLLEQTFIKDSGKTVKDYLAESGPQTVIRRFLRFHLGEEIK